MSAQKQKGFTLVELLVVISIIAILSVIGLTIYTSAQKFARDGKRKGDMDAIVKALIQYRTAKGVYPCFPTGCGWAIVSALTDLSSEYMAKIPDDPLGYNCVDPDGSGYLYSVLNNASKFTLFMKLENTNDAMALATKTAPTVPPGLCPEEDTSCTDDVDTSCSGGCVTYTIDHGTCGGEDYNYWVSNQL